MTALIHLSCAKSIETLVGYKEIHVHKKEGTTTNDDVQLYPELLMCNFVTREDVVLSNNIPIQEEPPDPSLFSHSVLNAESKFTEPLYKVSNTLFQIITNDTNDVLISLFSSEMCEKTLCSLEKSMDHISCFDSQVNVQHKTFIINSHDLVPTELFLPIYCDSMTVIMHLFFPKSVNNIAGSKEDHKGDLLEIMEKFMNQRKDQSGPVPLVVPTAQMDHERVPDSCQIKEEPPDSLLQAEIQRESHREIKRELGEFTKRTTVLFQNQDHGVQFPIVVKEKPPDPTKHSPTIPSRGNYLNSQKRMKANLLSLGAGKTFLRTKLFQEGGNDADIEPEVNPSHPDPIHHDHQPLGDHSPGDHSPGDHSLGDHSLGDHSPGDHSLSDHSLGDHSPGDHSPGDHSLGDHSLTDHSHGDHSPGDHSLGDHSLGDHPPGDHSPGDDFPPPIFEIHRQHAHFMKNHRETSAHQRSKSRDNREHLPEDVYMQAKPTMEESTRQFHLGFIIHQQTSHYGEFDRIKSPPVRSGSRNYQGALTEGHLLPKMDLSLFGSLETYVWRPGELLYHSETSPHVLRCTAPHLIRRIMLEPNFPYLDPFDINAQRDFLQTLVRLPELDSLHLDVPRCHLYAPKLSRLKPQRLLPYLDRFCHLSSNGHIFFYCCDFFQSFSL